MHQMRDLGILTVFTSARLRKRFEELLQIPFIFGLSHGDVADRNTLVNQRDEVVLLDWGNAEAHIVPHHELNEIMQSGLSSDSSEFQAFLDGYGVSQQEFKAMQPELQTLAALRTIDKLRWSIDRRPEKISEFAQRAQQATASL